MDQRAVLKANEFLWEENARLREENQLLRQRLSERDESRRLLAGLQEKHRKLAEQNAMLRRRVAELTEQLKAKPKAAPPLAFKPSVPQRRKKPGRKAGHAAALRPVPGKIDVHQDVPLPADAAGHASCPHCQTQLSDVKRHKRVVEEIIPAQVQVICYHTASGYCPSCRKHVESRAEEQPPAHDLPHAQLGLNALCTAAVLRVCYRLPLRQVTRLFQQLPGLKLSPAAVAKQLQRLSKWLDGQYHRLKLSLRVAGVVHADETSWRTGGKGGALLHGRNGYLWTLASDDATLYHVDRSRGGKVIGGLLGESFGSDGKGTLVSDFYAAYDRFKGSQQKCLAHLLRELKETAARRPELAGHALFKKCRRLLRDMLKLKSRRQELDADAYDRRVGLAEERLAALGEVRWGDADADRIANRLAKYREKLTTFLHRPEVDGTNNAAERALRPAVVMRKVTGGSRSEAGARAWAVLASVMRTAEQRGRDVLETLKTLLKAHWAGKEATLLSELLLPTIAADTS
jgi:transposase